MSLDIQAHQVDPREPSALQLIAEPHAAHSRSGRRPLRLRKGPARPMVERAPCHAAHATQPLLAWHHELCLGQRRVGGTRVDERARAVLPEAVVVNRVWLDAHSLPLQATVEEERIGYALVVIGRDVDVHAATAQL